MVREDENEEKMGEEKKVVIADWYDISDEKVEIGVQTQEEEEKELKEKESPQVPRTPPRRWMRRKEQEVTPEKEEQEMKRDEVEREMEKRRKEEEGDDEEEAGEGVRWAVKQGIADSDRVAIYGGSYGGYATLSGLTKTPDLYACGVSYVGVSNLFTWIAAIPPYWKPYLEMLHEMVGHPETDEQRFRETSPFFNADQIRVPLFVAQGANDPRVTKQESDQIVDALRGRGIDVEYLVKDNEGHGFQNGENRFEFYRAMEAFLDKHLGSGNGGDSV